MKGGTTVKIMPGVIERTIVDVFKLSNGQIAITLDDQSTIICSFARHVQEDPMKARFGRKTVVPHRRSPVREEADAMRHASEVAHLGGRDERRKIVHGQDFGTPESSEFMPEYVGVDRTLDETGGHALIVAQSTRDIPDVPR